MGKVTCQAYDLGGHASGNYNTVKPLSLSNKTIEKKYLYPQASETSIGFMYLRVEDLRKKKNDRGKPAYLPK